MEPVAVTGIVSGVGGVVAGLSGAAIAVRKVKPESENLAVSSLRMVLEDLRDELQRKDKELKDSLLKLELANRQLSRLESRLVEGILSDAS